MCPQSSTAIFYSFFSIGDFGGLASVDPPNILFAIGVSMLAVAEQRGIEISSTVRNSLDRWFNDVVQFDKRVEGGGLNFDLKLLKLKLE
jgi:hypothetical protein